jgi:hypothetical protein
VKKLKESFKRYGSVNEQIMVWVRMEDDLGQSPTDEDVASIKADFEVIAGAHSMEALKDCRRDYERNPLFTHATIHLFVDPDSLEARAAARATGGLDNIIRGLHREVSKSEIVLQVHKLLQRELKDLPQSRKAAVIKAVKQNAMAYYAINRNTMGTIMCLSMKTGEMWDLIDRCLTAREMPSGWKIPRTINKFNQLGGLDDDLVVGWLRQVCSGSLTLADLHGKCIAEKARKKVRKWIQEVIAVKCPKVGKQLVENMSWSTLASHFPHSTQESFIASWVTIGQARPASAGPPDLMKEALLTWIKLDLEAQAPVCTFRQK